MWNDEGNYPNNGVPIAQLIAENRLVSEKDINKLTEDLEQLYTHKQEERRESIQRERESVPGAIQTAMSLLQHIANTT